MNDRFRFRAWDKTNKIMVDEIGDGWFRLNFKNVCESDEFILEQCTGLKDKNGKLIYEGDIVRVFYDHFDGNFTEKEVVGPIVWKCGTWVVNGWFLNFAPEYDDMILESSAVEVIGNIHENPELLSKHTLEERAEELVKNNAGIPDYDEFYKALREGK